MCGQADSGTEGYRCGTFGANGAVFTDLNTISPVRSVEMAERCAESGWGFVDGSISGGPPSPSSSSDTRLYLSGEHAEILATLRSPGLAAHVVGIDAGVASAIKMCTASVYKGTMALWLQALETAAHFGVVDTVLDDLTTSWTGCDSRSRASYPGPRHGVPDSALTRYGWPDRVV